jgi:HAD superfamily hydrolase (TIGR01509 family)
LAASRSGHTPGMSNGRPGVLLDVDGTLIDSNYLHALAWSRALIEAGEWAPMNALHRLVGMGGDQLVVEVLGHDSEAARKARSGHYQAFYDDLRAFPSATQLLRQLAGRDLAVVLATSAPEDELQILLGILDAGDAITGYTTSDDVTSSKPDPEIFRTAMERFDLDPARTVAIGDSVWDIQAARSAGIGLIAVETGGFSQHELSEAGALHVYRDVAEIVDQLNFSPIAQLR